MRKIALFCAGGFSTSILVNKMKAAAQEEGYACEIDAYSVSEVASRAKDADIVLLGPQIRFNQESIKKQVSCPVAVIDMRAYGTVNGKAVLDQVKKVLND
ncbi:PTS sugar transporter subunit IIB [Holdemania massiliensis]|uniref:PTS sugar transporter subunit IIB n=1 Tax=Holdemania massiliensis TaxID=1468449 RepID=UPI001F06370C|nr:PTS sugar transporter subunit IIB [Holdemania massiliensis]MCH1942464.1 PTS sugar transporter subunit IIB [Holdemania massiliensis]